MEVLGLLSDAEITLSSCSTVVCQYAEACHLVCQYAEACRLVVFLLSDAGKCCDQLINPGTQYERAHCAFGWTLPGIGLGRVTGLRWSEVRRPVGAEP